MQYQAHANQNSIAVEQNADLPTVVSEFVERITDFEQTVEEQTEQIEDLEAELNEERESRVRADAEQRQLPHSVQPVRPSGGIRGSPFLLVNHSAGMMCHTGSLRCSSSSLRGTLAPRHR